ncbi:MAG: 3-deoxy-7-phosphoheptulonate synthase [Thermodesulfovibrionales bacterium]
MLIVMHHSAAPADVESIRKAVVSMGLKPVAIPGAERIAIGVIGNQGYIDDSMIRTMRGVSEIIHVTKPYKLVSRDFHPADTVVKFGRTLAVGGKSPLFMIAGPCAVESREQLRRTARFLQKTGIGVLRGGAYKPRTSPHSFQGLREEGIDLLSAVAKEHGLLTATEVMSPEHVSAVAEKIDILQVGARNMQNFDLLKEVGRSRRPVILKRGLSATVEEWLASAEYILVEGNPHVILCERGIRTFETVTRNTADLAVLPYIRMSSHLPVIFDPSHATGQRSLVAPMALAAVVAGAHGIMVEVHPSPEQALSDGPQSLHFSEFRRLYADLRKTEQFVRKNLRI